jgi:hypothetical protein
MPVENPILFVVVSKDDNLGPLVEKFPTFQDGHKLSFLHTVKNNKENITKVYNKIIDTAANSDFSAVVFVHADVDVDLDSLYSHINSCMEQFDVMGLCGCEKFSVSESPLNWFCGSRKYPQGRWGSVCHGELGDSVSFFSQDRSYITEHGVACIDGLCIIMTKKAMQSGLRFDERLRFNCYDTQISLDAVMNYKLRVGCLVEPSLKHFSVGRSILTDDFLVDEKVLRDRFGLGIPPNSKIEEFLKRTEQHTV